MTKSVASETDVPEGLDVVPMEPGTIVGSRDLQGTDGETRTDRPGEILGTPVAHGRTDARDREAARADYQTREVDRANREELPKLGGPIDDDWEPGDSKGSRTAELAPSARTAPANRVAEAAPARTTTDAAPAKTADSNIKVSSKIDRG